MALVTSVTVRSGELTETTASLQVGTVNQNVTVAADAKSLMDVASAEVATSLDAKTIQDIPSLDRDPVTLTSLSSAVVPVPTNHPFLLSGSYNADGQRGRANDITVDNAVATDIAVTGASGTNTFSLDSVQEVQLITAGFRAEFGRNSGSQLQIITKSGTNAFHGSVYEFLQNSALNARDFFDTTGKATPFQRNQWGFSAGGPLIKNRLLLSGDYEGVKSRGASSTAVATVLTPSQVAAITDPTSLALFHAVGAPQSANQSGLLSTAAPDTGNQYAWSVRADAFFRQDADQITVRSGNEVGTVVTPALTFADTGTNLPNYGAMNAFDSRTVTAGYTHLFTSQMVNQFRFQYQRGIQNFPPDTSLQQPYAPRSASSASAPWECRPFSPRGACEPCWPAARFLATGRHAFKFGGDVFRYHENSVNDTGARGEFIFTSTAGFQSGAPAEYVQEFGFPSRDYRLTDAFLFGQDDIRLTSTLTLNLGVRLESSGGASEVHNILANLDTGSQAPLGSAGSGPLGSINLGGSAYNRNNNWAPRLGAAWNPGHGKLVVRGGYGLLYDFLFLNPVLNLQFVAPYEYLLTVTNFSGNNTFANLAAGTAGDRPR